MRKFFLAVFVLSLIILPLGAQETGQAETPVEAQAKEAPPEAPSETPTSVPAGTQTEDKSFFSKVTWFARGTILFFPEDDGLAADPMPILPSPGLGASYPLSGLLSAELTLDFYMTHYGYDYNLDRAVPNAIENRSSLVIGSVLALQAAAHFDVTPFMTVRAYGGPAADLRIILVAEDLNSGDMDDARKQTNSVRSYFWSSGRWFMPVLGTGVDFAINDRIKLGIDMRVWAPVYRLWSGEHLPAIEGWRFGPGIRLTFK